MKKRLNQLRPGTRFRVPELGITGILLMVNECRARVRIDQPQTVEFTGRNGESRAFRAKRYVDTSWSPIVSVEVLSYEPLQQGDSTMAKKKASTTKKTATNRKAAAPKKQPAAKKNTNGSLSQIEAALKVLSESKAAMTAKQMIEAMDSKGYWTSPGGKTPHATLYSAILREIQKKGSDSRFVKVDKGQFGLKK